MHPIFTLDGPLELCCGHEPVLGLPCLHPGPHPRRDEEWNSRLAGGCCWLCGYCLVA